MADLGPGTMPRGKYPESPAPAGSHALISRTPTPGGMLHANLGLPRPPPRNFQPPLPRFPSRLSPRRMSGTTVGRILSHPLPWSRPPSCNRPQNKRQQHPKPSSFRNLRRKAAPLTGVATALSRSDCTGKNTAPRNFQKTKFLVAGRDELGRQDQSFRKSLGLNPG